MPAYETEPHPSGTPILGAGHQCLDERASTSAGSLVRAREGQMLEFFDFTEVQNRMRPVSGKEVVRDGILFSINEYVSRPEHCSNALSDLARQA